MSAPALDRNNAAGSDPRDHPAVLAWREVNGTSRAPTKVEELNPRRAKKQSPKSRVYRLHDALGAEIAVVAKLCKSKTAELEFEIYDQILPRLTLRSTKSFGALFEKVGTHSWLFLEDIGNVRYCWENPQHRWSAIEYFAVLHSECQYFNSVNLLPDGGTVRYLAHLDSAVNKLKSCIANPVFRSDEVDLLKKLYRICSILTDSRGIIEDMCEDWPKTLVHGDFNAKNARVQCQSSIDLLMIDWEMAGFGMPGPDLSAISMWGDYEAVRNYHRLTRVAWAHLTLEELLAMARLGSIFRLMAATDWECMTLCNRYSRRALSHLDVYCQRFEAEVAGLDWLAQKISI